MAETGDARGSAPALDLTTAQALLHDDAFALALCDADGRVLWCNQTLLDGAGQAARSWRDRPLAVLLGLSPADTQRLDDGLRQGRAMALPDMRWGAPGAPQPWWRAQLRVLGDGRRVATWLPADERRAAAAEAQRLAELLDMAEDFGRLGVWDSDVRTLQGRWDRHAHRFWGLREGQATPGDSLAAQCVVSDDRAALEHAFRESLHRAGTYSHRYRVRAPDGTLRRLRAQWQVKNGDDGQPERVIGTLSDETEAYALARAHDELAEQLGLALELGGIVVWRHDLRTEQVHFSDRAFEVLGLDRPVEALSAQQLREFVHPDDRPALREAVLQAIASGRPVDVETRFRHAGGSWRHMLTRRVLQRDADGEALALLGVSLDLSERVAFDKRQTELMRQFELTARTAGIGYWSVEADSKRSRWSAQTFELHGLPADAQALPLQQWLQRFVDPADRDQVQRRYAEWVRGSEQHLEQEFRIVRCDGSQRQVLSYSRREGRPGHYDFFGVLMDVTERRAAEAALRQASERAALATRGAGMGTWEQDMLTGEAIWDEQMWRLRGLQPRAQALTIDERMALVHPDDREVTLRKLREATAEGTLSNLEFRVRWPDGQWRTIASRAIAVRDAQGRPTRRIGVNWDVTDMRNAQLAQHERAVAQRESQAKSQFLARMSHELRTPLNAVLGFTQLLLSDGERVTAETRKRRFEQIHGAAQHLLSLINDVLDLSSLEGGELRMASQPVPLAALVAETLPLVARLARQYKVRLRSGTLDGVVLADATRLRQVLLNLLTNAVKYNREGGQVLVESEVQGDRVVLRVSDTGRGMNAAQLEQIFEPFNRLGVEHEGIEGTGIGLTIVKALVERMGGTVQLRSTPGEGSVFELRLSDGTRLEADQADPAGARRLGATATATAGQPARLLYIEDNPVNVLIVQELLARRSDLQLAVAVNGLSGLSLAAAVRPDLILVDMQLPDIDGLEVLRRLRADSATAGIPCISVSANAMPEDIDRALQAGFSDYWTKPLDLNQFMRSLDALFGAPGTGTS
jgi:PAS domain S-box-containing protein